MITYFNVGSLYKISSSTKTLWFSGSYESMPFTTLDIETVRVSKDATFLCLRKFQDDVGRSLAVFLTQTYKTGEPVEIRMFDEGSNVLLLVESQS